MESSGLGREEEKQRRRRGWWLHAQSFLKPVLLGDGVKEDGCELCGINSCGLCDNDAHSWVKEQVADHPVCKESH